MTVQVRASDDSDRNFIVRILLKYNSDEILPYDVELEFEGKKTKKKTIISVYSKTLFILHWMLSTDQQDFTDKDMADFELHCNPFFRLPLLKAFRAAF